MPRTRISDETRQMVIEARTRGVSVREVSKEFGISVSSVRRILKGKQTETAPDEKTKDRAGIERQRKIEDIERRIAELERKIRAADK
ncbi:MAG: helix-turn-helix domain-containing protein [Desulfatiglans sp.]|jgi:transposase-like protein|nr:helix-turn-helix domain-containing protein [Thermodesulfobacteriota bacterium]MEE4354052.1 helix-turn-helix domain-containing protein [Desulfatiglans sp.]